MAELAYLIGHLNNLVGSPIVVEDAQETLDGLAWSRQIEVEFEGREYLKLQVDEHFFVDCFLFGLRKERYHLEVTGRYRLFQLGGDQQ